MDKEELNKTDELVVRYLTSSISKKEEEEVMSWIDESEENRKDFLNSREVWFSSASLSGESVFDADAAYDKFLSRIEEKASSKRTVFFNSILKYAAVAAVFIGVLFGSFYVGKQNVVSQLAETTIEAPAGSRIKMELPDGTLVWLNASSKMSYKNSFGVSNRELKLKGEGYFEVAKNEDLPFEINSAGLKLKVLGTIFNFRAFEDEEEIIVTLAEGKVALSAHNTNAILLPNQKAVFNKLSGTIKTYRTKSDHFDDWVKGYLFFDEVQFKDIARSLERAYGVNVTFASQKLERLRFYAFFEKENVTIEEIMDRISKTRKFSYKIENNEVTIY